MARVNGTMINEFILLGLTDDQQLEVILFVVFLIIYGISLLGNLGMVMLIWSDHHLHTPMYFFLGNFSFVDACYSSAVAPKMLLDFLAKRKAISYNGCILQFCVFCSFADIESLLLAAMAYDRYVAICNPLMYNATMSRSLCICLVSGSYLGGIVSSLIHTCSALRLSFCKNNAINHFFCDLTALLALSCSDTSLNEMLLFTFGSLVEASSIITILASYTFIIVAILGIRSTEGRLKAFATCASHLIAVTMFHGTLLFMYFRPSSSYSMDTDKKASLFYTVVIPMLNPLIYSLRNKDVKDALKKKINLNIFPG
ncbi:olfactory receptor 5AR1-like [Alligator mississippiensis]|uniref:olfactory receptor 5AR1-like n=1 Tax=Alligator mississippiensis TaxID=8496 RepID=UPI0028780D47|nr:olfactory receptor 5AR1-like [Alligator mississippiensis]